jgi:hypothetical protein
MKTPLPSPPTMHYLIIKNHFHLSRLSSSTNSPHQRSTMALTLSRTSNVNLQGIERRQKLHFSTSGTSTTCRVAALFKGMRASRAWHLVVALGLSHLSLAELLKVLSIMLRVLEGLPTTQMTRFSGCRNKLYYLTFFIPCRSVLTSCQTMRVKTPFLKMIRACVSG